MASSTSAREPNVKPLERLAFRPLTLISGSQRRSRCLSSPDMSRHGNPGNPEADAVQREAAVPQLRESRPPPPLRARRSLMSRVGGLVIIMLLPAIIGFLVGKLPVSTFSEWQAGDRTFELVSSSSHLMKNLPAQRTELEPRLVADRSSGMSGEPVPLGLTLRGWADGGVVMIAGLVPGMSLSSGSAVGANAWQVPATDLPNTWIGPPQNFVGEVELIAELHLADATIAHRQSIRIEWIAATAAGPDPVAIASSPADSEQVPIAAGPASPEQVSVAATPPKAVAAPQELDQDEIAMKGGEDPPARNEQQGASSHERRAAGKRGTAPTRNKENAKASARQRAPDASAYVDEQQGASSDEKRAARKPGAPTRNKENAKASARQRAPDASAYVDHHHDVRHRSQWTRTRDHQGSDREFIEADGFRHIILPRRPSEPNEDIPAWLYALPRTPQ
jgi:hypothetical protein